MMCVCVEGGVVQAVGWGWGVGGGGAGRGGGGELLRCDTVNIDNFACIHFRVFKEIEHYAWI